MSDDESGSRARDRHAYWEGVGFTWVDLALLTAASLALRYAAARAAAAGPTQAAMPDESPRKLQVAVNQRVMRLLGLDYKQPRNGGLVVFK